MSLSGDGSPADQVRCTGMVKISPKTLNDSAMLAVRPSSRQTEAERPSTRTDCVSHLQRTVVLPAPGAPTKTCKREVASGGILCCHKSVRTVRINENSLANDSGGFSPW